MNFTAITFDATINKAAGLVVDSLVLETVEMRGVSTSGKHKYLLYTRLVLAPDFLSVCMHFTSMSLGFIRNNCSINYNGCFRREHVRP